MLTERPLKPNDLFAYLKKSFILIDLKLQGLLILHRFKIVIDISVLAGFAVVDKLNYCAACVGFLCLRFVGNVVCMSFPRREMF